MALSDTIPKRPGYGDVFSLFVFILSAALGWQAFTGITEFADLRDQGIVTEGTVADSYTDPNDGKAIVIYYFKVGYRTFRNKQQAPEGVRYTDGGTISVVYSPEYPEWSRIAGTEAIQINHVLILVICDISVILSVQYLFAHYTRRRAWVLQLIVFARRVTTGYKPYQPELSEEEIQHQAAEREQRQRRLRRNLTWGAIVGAGVLVTVLGVILVMYIQDARLRAKYEDRADRVESEAVVQEFDGVKMVLVSTGCFDMGIQGIGGKQCFDNPFWIDQYEVTNEQYGSIGCGDNSSQPDQPRTCVSWVDASNFCESRGARLPTEAEWEYAARGPDNLMYPWGNEFVADNVVYRDNSSGYTAVVSIRYRGISWSGAYDLSGSVWEWTSSLHRDYPYDVDDGREIFTTNNSLRVLRGGSFDNTKDFLRTTVRLPGSPGYVDKFRGFRCVRAYNIP